MFITVDFPISDFTVPALSRTKKTININVKDYTPLCLTALNSGNQFAFIATQYLDAKNNQWTGIWSNVKDIDYSTYAASICVLYVKNN